MSTGPGSVNPDAEPLDPDPTGQDPSAKDPTAEEKMLLQAAIFDATREAAGRSLSEIKEMLQAGFARRGVQAPTPMWLDAVASAAFHGESYIIDFPAALAAEGAAPAPDQALRERLAVRRGLREEKLPAGIFPPASAWELDDNDVTSGDPETGRRPNARAGWGGRTGLWKAVSAAGLAALLAFAALRAFAVNNARSVKGPGAKRTTAGGA